METITTRVVLAVEAAKGRYRELTDKSASEEGLETAEKVFLVVGGILIAGTAIAFLGTYVAGQLNLLPSN